MAFTPEQDAALLDQMRRDAVAFAEWSAAVQSGTVRLQGAERDAFRAGYRAGRDRAANDERAAVCAKFTPRQLVAFAVGYGEGRTMPHENTRSSSGPQQR